MGGGKGKRNVGLWSSNYIRNNATLSLPRTIRCSNCSKNKMTANNFSEAQQAYLCQQIFNKGQEVALRDGAICIVCNSQPTEKKCNDCERVLGLERYNKTQRKLDEGRCEECMTERNEKKPAPRDPDDKVIKYDEDFGDPNEGDVGSDYGSSRESASEADSEDFHSGSTISAAYHERSSSSATSRDSLPPGGGVFLDEAWAYSGPGESSKHMRTGNGSTNSSTVGGTYGSSNRNVGFQPSRPVLTLEALRAIPRAPPSEAESVQSSVDTETGSRAHFPRRNENARFPRPPRAPPIETVRHKVEDDGEWVDKSRPADSNSDEEEEDDHYGEQDEDFFG